MLLYFRFHSKLLCYLSILFAFISIFFFLLHTFFTPFARVTFNSNFPEIKSKEAVKTEKEKKKKKKHAFDSRVRCRAIKVTPDIVT